MRLTDYSTGVTKTRVVLSNSEPRSDKNCPQRRGYLGREWCYTSQVFFYVLSLFDLEMKGLRKRGCEVEQREPSTRTAQALAWVDLRISARVGAVWWVSDAWKNTHAARNGLDQLPSARLGFIPRFLHQARHKKSQLATLFLENTSRWPKPGTGNPGTKTRSPTSNIDALQLGANRFAALWALVSPPTEQSEHSVRMPSSTQRITAGKTSGSAGYFFANELPAWQASTVAVLWSLPWGKRGARSSITHGTPAVRPGLTAVQYAATAAEGLLPYYLNTYLLLPRWQALLRARLLIRFIC